MTGKVLNFFWMYVHTSLNYYFLQVKLTFMLLVQFDVHAAINNVDDEKTHQQDNKLVYRARGTYKNGHIHIYKSLRVSYIPVPGLLYM